MPQRIDPSALLTAIVASSDDAIVSKDVNGIITSWNRGAERLFGYSAEEAVGQSIKLIIPPERHHEEDEVLARIRRGDMVDHFETIRRRKDGTLVPISLTVSPVRDASGKVVGASKIARDITERWRADAAIAEAQAAETDLQQRLLALVEASHTVFESPRTADVLPATLRLAGKLVPADGYAVWRLDQSLAQWGVGSYTGISAEFANAIIRSYNGTQVTVVPFSEPLVCEDVASTPLLAERRDAYARERIRSMLAIPLSVRGQLTATLVFYYRQTHRFSDVEVQTARALGNLAAAAMTTAELYEEQEHSNRRATFLAEAGEALGSSLEYQTTLRTVANMAVPHVADWCIVHLVAEDGSIEQLAMAHTNPEKIEFARTFQQRYPENTSSPYSVATVIRTGKPVVMERVPDELLTGGAQSEQHLKDLRYLGLQSFMIVPMVARGRTLGAITFVSAESHRHYSMLDLRLAEAIASRAALAVENARAYDEARRANRLKDDFLATLSHELRTPLNAILGYARMLRMGVVSTDKRQRAIEVLERSAGALTQIVEDILDVSRITSGKIRLNLANVELPIVVNDAVATVLPAAEAKGISVETVVDPLVGSVRGDADRLQQVVWNLVSNAVKFTPRGGRVDVGVEPGDGYAEIVVRDTGIGFRPEFGPHLFERFRQANSGFAREHGGLGLGLAIARHLVEMHGGTIHAASAGPDKGATFRVRLPTREAPESARSGRVGPLAGILNEQRQHLDGVHVLIVDDDPDALELARDVLEAAGSRVSTASSAEIALAQISRDRPTVMVADLGMPGVDGFELIDRIRDSSDSRVRSLPAAALTAYARSEDRAKALRHGFQMHLAKPLDPTELVAAIASLAGESNSTAS